MTVKLQHADDVKRDMCRTRNCGNEPVMGALYCDACYDLIEAEHWELKEAANAEQRFEQMRDEE